MGAIPEHIKFIFQLYITRCRIIQLNPEGYKESSRKVPFEAFAKLCWFPAYYDSDDQHDKIGIFYGHEEMPTKYHVCWN